MKAVGQNNVVVLNISKKGSQVLVVPEDKDKFCMSIEAAIEACHVYEQVQSRFKDQVDRLQEHLAVWLENHTSKLSKVFLTLKQGGFLFIIVTKRSKFDSNLHDCVSDLILDIANDPEFSVINFDSQVLPPMDSDFLAAFINPNWTLEYKFSD